MTKRLISVCIAMLVSSSFWLRGSQEPRHVDVFVARQGGYHTYRIPSLTQAPDGSLIAIVEARKHSSFDPGHGDIDLVYKRSTDGGETWSALKILDDPGAEWSASNATTVVDSRTGRILLLFNRWEPARGNRQLPSRHPPQPNLAALQSRPGNDLVHSA